MRERKKAGKKEREITVLTLLVEALSHMSQSHSLSLSLSLSSDHYPLILSSTIMKIQKKNKKQQPLTGTEKELFLFSFRSETCTPRLAADPRYLKLYCM